VASNADQRHAKYLGYVDVPDEETASRLQRNSTSLRRCEILNAFQRRNDPTRVVCVMTNIEGGVDLIAASSPPAALRN
jgi:hypothetical protein